jgi:pimeloyl-ACP methyl ester carboxylesterase
MVDYRGYGKSEGSINGNKYFRNAKHVYELRKRYTEDKIIVLGYSIGTGPLTKIASTNKPKC